MRKDRRALVLGLGATAIGATAIAATGYELFLKPNAQTAGGWIKDERNPLLGGSYGTCFDATVLKERDLYRMWFSWRPERSLGYCESKDGARWTPPVVVLKPNDSETDVNRPGIIRHDGKLKAWFTSQDDEGSSISYAESTDGLNWSRSDRPQLVAGQVWEKSDVMCPDVMWDEERSIFRMWYSGGEQYEPDAIGYATSSDGVNWQKRSSGPIFIADGAASWEQLKVTGAAVRKYGPWHYMFYIGFRDIHSAAIGVARSKDGVTGWTRYSANPIIRPGWRKAWDSSAVYKPAPLLEGDRWLLWYNGRKGNLEQIGLAVHDGAELF